MSRSRYLGQLGFENQIYPVQNGPKFWVKDDRYIIDNIQKTIQEFGGQEGVPLTTLEDPHWLVHA